MVVAVFDRLMVMEIGGIRTCSGSTTDHQAELDALLDIFLPADLAKLSAVVSSAAKMVAQDGKDAFIRH